MTTKAATKRMTKGRVACGTVVAAALAATAFFGLSPTAQADVLRHLFGPERATVAEAEADIPGLEQQCRDEEGRVLGSFVGEGPTSEGEFFSAVVECGATKETRELLGPERATEAEAKKDIPGLEQQCRDEGGKVLDSSVARVSTTEGALFKATVACSLPL